MTIVVVLHAAATLFLAGIIWTIQVVHYPLFAAVGKDAFPAYEAAHSARITWLIAVPWGLQGATIAWLLLAPPTGAPGWLLWAAAGFAALPVAVTLAVSVPAHRLLANGFDATVHERLVATIGCEPSRGVVAG